MLNMVAVLDGRKKKKNRVMRVRVVSGSGVWVLQSLGREKMKNRERKKWRSATQKNGKQKTSGRAHV